LHWLCNETHRVRVGVCDKIIKSSDTDCLEYTYTRTTPLLQSSLAESKTKRVNILWRKRGISVLYTLSETSASQVMLNLRWQTQQRRKPSIAGAQCCCMPHKAEIKNVLTKRERGWSANRTEARTHLMYYIDPTLSFTAADL
jgi:hypothetical protein